MPNLVGSFKLVVRRSTKFLASKSTNYKLPTTHFYSGFSLIELMVVVSLIGIAVSLVTASYLNFERGNRVKNAAVALKNDLRLVQNKASSGDKGPGSACPSTAASTLGGWYLLADFNVGSNTSYRIGGDCLISGVNETIFFDSLGSDKTIKLPADTKINRIFYCNGNLGQPIATLFRPLKVGVSFHNGAATFPGFFNNTDGITLENAMPGLPQNSWVAIELSDAAPVASRHYWVKIEITGEINESKILPTGC